MKEPYYFTRTLGYQSETRYFEHSHQLHAAVLEWRYSLPGYFSDRPIQIPDHETVAYGARQYSQLPLKTIKERFSPSKDSCVRSNTVAARSLVKIKCDHRNSDLFIVEGRCLRADVGTEIPVGMYNLFGIDFKLGKGELMIVEEVVP